MKTVIALIAIYLSAIAYLYFAQEHLIFKKEFARAYTPINAKTVTFKTSDGIKLEGGYVEHGKDLPLVLYFGGNASNVLMFLDDTANRMKNYNFIAFNYPGYGDSEGKPSEKSILKYALQIAKQHKPDIVIGRSLGTAVASYVASKVPVKTLLLITPFDSIENVAQNKYPIFPVKMLVKHKFKEVEFLKESKAGKINAIFVETDEVIPKESIINLQNQIEFNKTKTINAGHNRIYQYPTIHKVIENLLE